MCEDAMLTHVYTHILTINVKKRQLFLGSLESQELL